jgi:salicylate hydroxylase
VIVGAGIAGLTAALALEQSGFSVLILDQAERLEEAGAGLQLSPNATSILSKLGVLKDLLPSATVLDSVDLISAKSAKPLLCLKTAPFAEDAAPCLALHRADLQSALLRHVQRRPHIELQLDATLLSHQQTSDGITVTCQVGGKSVAAMAQLIISADGVWSSLRQNANGAPARFSGYVAHRQTIDRSQLKSASLTQTNSVRAFLSPNAHLVAYPISAGKQINLVFIKKPAKQNAGRNELNMAPSFEGFASGLVQDLVQLGDWTSWPIHTVDADAPWRLNERTLLIGDAAHAMLPFGAQGAAMAIEDAYVLAHCLAQNRTNISSAFSSYEAMRRKRVKQVAERSKLNAFAYHATGPVAVARNLVFATRGRRLMQDLEWLYAYRAPGIS